MRGLLTEVADPTLIEMCGHAGLDFVCLDFEHGSIADAMSDGAVRAGELVELPLLARVRLEEMPRAARFLDSGGAGIIVAHVSSLDDVNLASDALLIPPQGRRGVGATRISRLGFDPTDGEWAARQNSELVLGAQIEDAMGVKNVRDIAAHPHVSVVLVGTRDLSFDLGVPGRYDEPAVKAALEEVRAGCAGRTAFGLMVRNLASEESLGSPFLVLGLGPLMRYSTSRLREIK